MVSPSWFRTLTLLFLLLAGVLACAAQSKSAGQALRARVEQYYSLLQAGRWGEAEKFVLPQARANFREQAKTPPVAYEYESASIDESTKTATVSVKVEGFTAVGHFTVPVKTIWRLVTGTWYIDVPKPEARTTTGPGIAHKALPPEIRFEPAELNLGTVTDAAVIERRIRFTNVSDHQVTVEAFVPGESEWLKVSATRKVLKPQEDAELVAQFNPVGYYGFFAQSIAVRTNPGARLAFVRVSAVVGTAPKEEKPKDSKP